MSTAAALPADCANCGAPLNGRYCPACGQKAASPNVSLHEFFHEAFHEFAHVDGKIVQTLRLLLTRPGQLTREFLDGRRSGTSHRIAAPPWEPSSGRKPGPLTAIAIEHPHEFDDILTELSRTTLPDVTRQGGVLEHLSKL